MEIGKNPITPRWVIFSAMGCGIFAGVLGLAVLVGWHFHLTSVIHVRPEFVAMQYLTASGFVLSGAALMGYVARWPRGVVVILALIPAVLGAMLLLEYLTGVSNAFDHLLSWQRPTAAESLGMFPKSKCMALFLLQI